MSKSPKEFQAEIDELRLRLNEAEETLSAIGSGEVDAFVVSGPNGEEQIFTLKGAEHPYRIMVENMSEGAASLTTDGTILYCNSRLASLLQVSLENIIGTQLASYVAPADLSRFFALLDECTENVVKNELTMLTETGVAVPVFFSCCAHEHWGNSGVSVVITDLTEQKYNERIAASEAALRASEKEIVAATQRLSALMEAAPVGISFSDDIFCQRITGNPVALAQFHLSQDDNLSASAPETDAPGRKIRYFLDGRELSDSELPMQLALAGNKKVPPMELEVLMPDGRRWFTEASGAPVQDKQGNIIAGIAVTVDITARKRAEEALRESEERHRLLAETMLQGVVHQDASGTIISMNPAAERILGKNREDFLGNRSVDMELDTIYENGEIFPGEEHPTMVALRTGQPVRGVVMGVFNPKVKEYRWIGIDAVPVFRPGEHLPLEVYSIFGDITERKQAEIALQESEQRMQQALHVSRSFTFDWSPASDQVKRSASCVAILNLYGDEAVNVTGDHYLQCIHPDDRIGFMQILRDLTPTANSYLTEYRYVRNDGSEITLEETGQASFDPDGTVNRLVGVATDISVRKQAQEALRKVLTELESRVEERTSDLTEAVKILEEEIHERQNAEKALYQETLERLKAVETLREKEQMLILQSRQAAMGEMIGNIAHQWRQPLNTLGLYTQQLGVFYGSPSFNKEFLDNFIAKSMEIIQHMSKTIDDFRDYFKPDKEKADFYVIDAIKSTLSLLEGNFDSPKITIDFVAHDNPVINGYQNEFAQVFHNILNNARDAIIERKIADGRILITISSEDSSAVVTVADNAGGIPDEVIYKVFDPYFTTKGPKVGTGIGLFMSKTIIEKNMGGTLSVCNTDTGAEFRIEVEHGNKN